MHLTNEFVFNYYRFMFLDHEFGFMSDLNVRRYFDICDSIIYHSVIEKENKYLERNY